MEKTLSRTEHALGVRHRGEEGGLRAAADGLGRAVLALELGVEPLEFLEPAQVAVVLLVGGEHGVALVVGVAQLEDAAS